MVNIKMVKKKDMVLLNGLMEKYLKDNGKMENKMVKENYIYQIIINGEKVFGKMEKIYYELRLYLIIFNIIQIKSFI